MNTVIYTGLSISFEEAENILKAEYKPPIKRGDLTKLLQQRDDVEIIGIIDGVFHQSPAVAHKEILQALDNDIIVVGGASMGALRACELYPYGMRGVGTIFNDYKNGAIDSDDDVAVSFNPETYQQMSESWINMKYNFQMARDDGIISDQEKDDLLEISKNTYYPKRSFEYTVKKSSLDAEKQKQLLEYIKDKDFDIKYEDAKKVIIEIKKIKEEIL
ncbi:MAG: TfuA domain protein core [Methanosphaera sp. rholeuAM74]|nr:MAG: TfuA domain protein core [Methanosphaera sp. rholeuAM74]